MNEVSNQCESRHEFMRQVESRFEAIHRGEVEGPVAMLIGEIDAFDLINDWHGFRDVDALLRRMSIKLVAQLEAFRSETDGAYVIGGYARGRFAVALFGALARDVSLVADGLRANLQGNYILQGRQRMVSLSLGCSMPEAVPQLDQLVAVARASLQIAQESGGDRVEVCDRGGLDSHARTCMLGRDLQLAISRDQLRLEYQPIFNLESVTVEGFEALLRWDHPVLGLVSPGEFIPIAAQSRYLGPMGDWVLGRACLDFARLRDEAVFPNLRFISVNVSRQNLGDRGLQQKVLASLAAARMEPAQLHLEITESELACNLQKAVETVRAIRALGVRVAIDDFGVGYSSLASLHQFPVDMLKLDRSILLRNFSGEEGRGLMAVAHAIVNLAQNVNLEVVAEGVETLEQIALLHSLQCPLAQGYLLGRPMRLEDLMRSAGAGGSVAIANAIRPPVAAY